MGTFCPRSVVTPNRRELSATGQADGKPWGAGVFRWAGFLAVEIVGTLSALGSLPGPPLSLGG